MSGSCAKYEISKNYLTHGQTLDGNVFPLSAGTTDGQQVPCALGVNKTKRTISRYLRTCCSRRTSRRLCRRGGAAGTTIAAGGRVVLRGVATVLPSSAFARSFDPRTRIAPFALHWFCAYGLRGLRNNYNALVSIIRRIIAWRKGGNAEYTVRFCRVTRDDGEISIK